MEKTSSVCPYCGEASGFAGLHEEKCPLRPENAEAIQSELRYLSELGVMPPMRRYDSLARDLGIAQSRLLHRVFGGWDQVARWCGLLPFSCRKDVRLETARLVLRDLQNELHDDECGPTPSEYAWNSPDGSPDVSYLQKHVGSWPEVLEWAGCKPYVVRRYREPDPEPDLPRFTEAMMALDPPPLLADDPRPIRYRNRMGEVVTGWVARLK